MASGTQTLETPSLFLTAYASYSAHSNTDDAPPPSVPHLLSPLPHDIPHSKLIPATRFLVDGFRFAGGHSVSYFLSHFHSDHYAGLTPAWCKGVIFCSEVTARLLVETLKVPRFFVVGLSLGKSVSIDGCEVTLVDANHCPGAVQFFFKVPRADGEGFLRYVHTGDFRFHESMKSDSILGGFVGSDAVFLDTTYCNPKFTFPSQDETVEYVVSTIDRTMAQSKGSSERVLFLIATYVVGKERILVEVSRRCNCLVHVDDAKKLGVLRILGYGDSRIFTDDASVTDVHVIGWNLLGETWPFFRPNFVKMGEMMRERGYAKAVGFVPTGWMYETKRDGFAVRVKDSLEIHLVPYSEHSSYSELREYIRFLRPKRVIPTVGLDIEKLDSKRVVAMQKHFACLVDQTANKQDFLADFWQRKRNSEEREGHNLNVGSNHGGQVKSVEDVKKDNDPSTPNVDKDTEQEASLQSADVLDENMELTIEELSYSLPSWVTRDQMLGLLTSSGGDIVEAVSEFYEYETDLFEQVNCSSASVSHVGPSGDDTEGSKPRNVPKNLDCSINPNSVLLKLTNRNIVNSKTISPKKRRSTIGSKPKKKGKKCATSELSGSKQSAITKFFQKLVHQPPCVSRHGSSKGESQDTQSEDRMQLSVDPAESYSDELDQFLEIINFGTPRKSAASLLEKANGNLNAALELYYSISHGTVFNEYISNVCSIDVHPQGSANYNNTDNKEKPSKEIIDLRTSSTQDNMVADISATFVSLPVENYSPIEHACWKPGQPAPYLHLARTFDLVEQEKGKIKTSAILCNMFRSLLALSPEDVLAAVYLCTNKIAPDHENMELNIGYGMVTAALGEACGTNRSRLREMYNDLGDLGDVAQICRQTQSLLAPPRPLSVKTLFSALRRMSMETGAGCAIRRKNIIIKLMCSCREKEIKFLVRTLVRNLRIGAMMKTILPSLAQAVVLQHQEGPFGRLREKLQLISTEVVEAYNIIPNLDLLIPALLSKNIDFSSSSLLVVPGMPIPSMLARITNGIPQVLKSFHGRAFTCEYKYDGQRAQIHRELDGSIRVFSRNMGDITAKYPDLVETIQNLCKPMVKTFILDSEVVAVDRKNENRLMAFQHLSTRERGRKCSSIAVDSIKVDICIFVFDIMLYNEQQLLDLPLRERRKYLSDLISNEKMGYLEFTKAITVEADRASLNDQGTLSEVHSFLEDACRSSCEGIMVKSLDADSRYAASKRTDAWLKVKRDYVEGLGDSVDLVPIGAWHGNGRKAKWYSPFLMACYNPDTEEFQSVCRIMSGFSDSFYAEMEEYFSGDKILPRKPPYYRTDEVPDLWYSSKLVWEIRGAEFTISPVHHAAIGLVHPSRGISIRFPRCIRTMLDKKPEDCSTAADIADMFQSQSRKMEVNVQD